MLPSHEASLANSSTNSSRFDRGRCSWTEAKGSTRNALRNVHLESTSDWTFYRIATSCRAEPLRASQSMRRAALPARRGLIREARSHELSKDTEVASWFYGAGVCNSVRVLMERSCGSHRGHDSFDVNSTLRWQPNFLPKAGASPNLNTHVLLVEASNFDPAVKMFGVQRVSQDLSDILKPSRVHDVVNPRHGSYDIGCWYVCAPRTFFLCIFALLLHLRYCFSPPCVLPHPSPPLPV